MLDPFVSVLSKSLDSKHTVVSSDDDDDDDY